MSFNQRLRLLFIVTGDSQTEIAVRAGLEPNRISKWMWGQGEPGPDQVGLLADAFGVGTDFFVRPLAPKLADVIGIDRDRIRTVERPRRPKAALLT